MEAILALLVQYGVPAILGWLAKEIQLIYSDWKKNKDIFNAIDKQQQTGDQRDVEKIIGNPSPGEPSGDPGAVIVDHPPDGMPKSK